MTTRRSAILGGLADKRRSPTSDNQQHCDMALLYLAMMLYWAPPLALSEPGAWSGGVPISCGHPSLRRWERCRTIGSNR